MQIITRAVIQSISDGEVVETFDNPERATRSGPAAGPLLAGVRRTVRPGYTRVEGLDEPVNIGWVFAVPERFTVPAQHDDFELLLIPMVTDPDDRSLVSLFVRLAEQRQEFQHLHEGGVADSFTVVTLPQRDLDDPR